MEPAADISSTFSFMDFWLATIDFKSPLFSPPPQFSYYNNLGDLGPIVCFINNPFWRSHTGFCRFSFSSGCGRHFFFSFSDWSSILLKSVTLVASNLTIKEFRWYFWQSTSKTCVLTTDCHWIPQIWVKLSTIAHSTQESDAKQLKCAWVEHIS